MAMNKSEGMDWFCTGPWKGQGSCVGAGVKSSLLWALGVARLEGLRSGIIVPIRIELVRGHGHLQLISHLLAPQSHC